MKSKFFALILVSALVVAMTGTSLAGKKKSKAAPVEEVKEKVQYVIHVTQGTKAMGDITLELYPEVAPLHCANFDSLVTIGFYDGCAFHRVIPGFMIQGGDPNSKNKPKSTWGTGDPSQKTVPAEFNNISHQRGILSAARTNDPNSATSQFFICVDSRPYLDHQYTVFGKVVSGMEVADAIVNSPRDQKDNPLEKIEMKIEKVTVKVIPEKPAKKQSKKKKK